MSQNKSERGWWSDDDSEVPEVTEVPENNPNGTLKSSVAELKKSQAEKSQAEKSQLKGNGWRRKSDSSLLATIDEKGEEIPSTPPASHDLPVPPNPISTPNTMANSQASTPIPPMPIQGVGPLDPCAQQQPGMTHVLIGLMIQLLFSRGISCDGVFAQPGDYVRYYVSLIFYSLITNDDIRTFLLGAKITTYSIIEESKYIEAGFKGGKNNFGLFGFNVEAYIDARDYLINLLLISLNYHPYVSTPDERKVFWDGHGSKHNTVIAIAISKTENEGTYAHVVKYLGEVFGLSLGSPNNITCSAEVVARQDLRWKNEFLEMARGICCQDPEDPEDGNMNEKNGKAIYGTVVHTLDEEKIRKLCEIFGIDPSLSRQEISNQLRRIYENTPRVARDYLTKNIEEFLDDTLTTTIAIAILERLNEDDTEETEGNEDDTEETEGHEDGTKKTIDAIEKSIAYMLIAVTGNSSNPFGDVVLAFTDLLSCIVKNISEPCEGKYGEFNGFFKKFLKEVNTFYRKWIQPFKFCHLYDTRTNLTSFYILKHFAVICMVYLQGGSREMVKIAFFELVEKMVALTAKSYGKELDANLVSPVGTAGRISRKAIRDAIFAIENSMGMMRDGSRVSSASSFMTDTVGSDILDLFSTLNSMSLSKDYREVVEIVKKALKLGRTDEEAIKPFLQAIISGDDNAFISASIVFAGSIAE
jgi:hypothetical protein